MLMTEITLCQTQKYLTFLWTPLHWPNKDNSPALCNLLPWVTTTPLIIPSPIINPNPIISKVLEGQEVFSIFHNLFILLANNNINNNINNINNNTTAS